MSCALYSKFIDPVFCKCKNGNLLENSTNFMFFRKYVQVCIQNLSELCFQLSDNNLKNTADCTDLQLVPLNPESQQVKRFSWCFVSLLTGKLDETASNTISTSVRNFCL